MTRLAGPASAIAGVALLASRHPG